MKALDSEDIQDCWECAPCGHIIAEPSGRIVRANSTLLGWLGYRAEALCGKTIGDLMSVGGRIHYETHFGPLLRMSGALQGIAVDLLTIDGTRLPMLLTANVRTGSDGLPELFRITVVEAGDRRAYELELIEQRKRVEQQRDQVKVFAETVRRSLQPPVLSPPPGMEAADYCYTSSPDNVGGDFYDLFPLTRSMWGFFLGDVVGKGVDAAVVAGLARYVLRSAAVSDDDPIAVLHNLHSVLSQELGVGDHRFCTLIYGNIIKRGNGFDVEIASGGHPPPVLITADGVALYADTVGGHAVGLNQDPQFVSSRLHLGPGDTLVLYTDGLTEASIGIGHERYDDDGALLRFVQDQTPTNTIHIVDALRTELDRLGKGVEDDCTLLALGVPVGRRRERPQQHPDLSVKRVDAPKTAQITGADHLSS